MIAWILATQSQLASSQGVQLTPADFGAPADLAVYTPRQLGAGSAAAANCPYGTSEDQQRPPMAPANGLGQLNRGKAALMVKAVHAQGDAATQALYAKERNQRGHNIFG